MYRRPSSVNNDLSSCSDYLLATIHDPFISVSYESATGLKRFSLCQGHSGFPRFKANYTEGFYTNMWDLGIYKWFLLRISYDPLIHEAALTWPNKNTSLVPIQSCQTGGCCMNDILPMQALIFRMADGVPFYRHCWHKCRFPPCNTHHNDM